MVVYAELGNRTQAVRTYSQCVDRLRAELGVPPSAGTVAVHEGLRVD